MNPFERFPVTSIGAVNALKAALDFKAAMEEIQSTHGVASIPEHVCSMCMRPAKLAPELLMVEVSYWGYYGKRILCLDCKERVVAAISRTLSELRW